MNFGLFTIRKRTVSVLEYIAHLERPFQDMYLARKLTYQLQQEAVNQLKRFAREYAIIAFSAGWCKDCAANISVLALIAEATGLEVRIFGGLKKDPLSHSCKWRIPPSPPEVKTLNIDKIPLIIVVDMKGREIGRIAEKPQQFPTLE